MSTSRPLLLALLVVAGCGGAATGGDAATPLDLSAAPDQAAPATMDASTFDASPVRGIACGDTPCAANAQYCCTSNQGKTGLCGFGNEATCGSALFYCDGPEDCPPAEPYCCVVNGTAQCKQSMCAGTIEAGFAMCHNVNDCMGSGPCCGSTSGSPYRLCLPAGCT